MADQPTAGHRLTTPEQIQRLQRNAKLAADGKAFCSGCGMILGLQEALVIARFGMPLLAMCPACLTAYEIRVWASEGQIRVKRRRRGDLYAETVSDGLGGPADDLGVVRPDVTKTDFSKDV